MARSAVQLVRTLDYKLHPQAPQWAGFEFMIGTHGRKAVGQLGIEIVDDTSGSIVRTRSLELDDITDNEIVQIDFDEIYDSKDKYFTAQFSLKVFDSKTTISIYEENETESKGKHILRRLGLLTRGNTLACRLLYSQ